MIGLIGVSFKILLNYYSMLLILVSCFRLVDKDKVVIIDGGNYIKGNEISISS